MDTRPIGVFDSGLGGLTAVKELRKILPHEDIVYFGDTGRVPYGSRSRETIVRYARQDMAFLRSKDVKMIVAACGTVSSVAEGLGDGLGIPFTGVLGPTAAAAAASTKNGRVGVIGTSATIHSGSFRRELARIRPDVRVFEKDCPLFVPLVENGFISEDNQVTRLVAEQYLAPLRGEGIDTLILGCTHYPIIRTVISDVMGKAVATVDSGRETALYCKKILEKQRLLGDGQKSGTAAFYVSDRVEGFSSVAGIFLGRNVDCEVSRVDIDQY